MHKLNNKESNGFNVEVQIPVGFMRLRFMAVYLQVCVKKKNKKKKKKKLAKKMSNFFKAHISGMAGTIYFKSGMYSLAPAQRIWSGSD